MAAAEGGGHGSDGGGTLYSGWLQLKQYKLALWHRRYFVLRRDSTLCYYRHAPPGLEPAVRHAGEEEDRGGGGGGGGAGEGEGDGAARRAGDGDAGDAAAEDEAPRKTYDLLPGCCVSEISERKWGKHGLLYVFWLVWPEKDSGKESGAKDKQAHGSPQQQPQQLPAQSEPTTPTTSATALQQATPVDGTAMAAAAAVHVREQGGRRRARTDAAHARGQHAIATAAPVHEVAAGGHGIRGGGGGGGGGLLLEGTAVAADSDDEDEDDADTASTCSGAGAGAGAGAGGRKDLKSIVESHAHSVKMSYRRAEARIRSLENRDANSTKNIATASAVVVGGAVLGVLTAGVGLIPLAIFGVGAAAAGGAAYSYRKPVGSRLIIGAETMEQALQWRDAIHNQILVLEGRCPPPIPDSSLSTATMWMGSAHHWTAVETREGHRIFEENEHTAHVATTHRRVQHDPNPASVTLLTDKDRQSAQRNRKCQKDTTRPRKLRVVMSTPPMHMFLALMETQYAKLFHVIHTMEVKASVDDHSDIVHLTFEKVLPPWLQWAEPFIPAHDFCLNRFWRIDDDGTFVICMNSTEHASCPPAKGYVRSTLHSIYAITPRKDFEEYDDEADECLVTCICQIDSRSWVAGYLPENEWLMNEYLTQLIDANHHFLESPFLQPSNTNTSNKAAAGGKRGGLAATAVQTPQALQQPQQQLGARSADDVVRAAAMGSVSAWSTPERPHNGTTGLTPEQLSYSTPRPHAPASMARSIEVPRYGVDIEPVNPVGGLSSVRVEVGSPSATDLDEIPTPHRRRLSSGSLTAKQRRRTRSKPVNSEAAYIRRMVDAKEYELERLLKIIQKDAKRGNIGSRNEPLMLYNMLSEEVATLKQRYEQLTHNSLAKLKRSERKRFSFGRRSSAAVSAPHALAMANATHMVDAQAHTHTQQPHSAPRQIANVARQQPGTTPGAGSGGVFAQTPASDPGRTARRNTIAAHANLPLDDDVQGPRGRRVSDAVSLRNSPPMYAVSNQLPYARQHLHVPSFWIDADCSHHIYWDTRKAQARAMALFVFVVIVATAMAVLLRSIIN